MESKAAKESTTLVNGRQKRPGGTRGTRRFRENGDYCAFQHGLSYFGFLMVKIFTTVMARAKGVSLTFMASLYICAIVGAEGAEGATFVIQNNCGFTVWAAGSPGGGMQLDRGQSWTVQVAAKTTRGRFWGRTGCSFNSSGQGSCQTGDCEGSLNCKGFGATPATLVEYSIDENDLYSISLVDGFNLPLSIIPSNLSCPAISCSSKKSSISPSELRVSDSCNSACTSFKTPEYCCPGNHSNSCSTSYYSKFFNGQCPRGYSYAKNDTASTFSCSGSTDYKVVFCGNLEEPPTSLPSGKTKSKLLPILLGSVVGPTLIVTLCLVFVRHCKSFIRTDKNLDVRGDYGEVLFDYKVLRDSIGNFDRNNMLGKGGFGEVYKGRLPNGRDVAVKKLHGKHTAQAAEEFLTEVKLISSVRHRNLVRLLGCCKRGHKRLLVYEFMSNNSLDKHLFGEIRNPLSWENRLNIIVGTARGLGYLHDESNVRIIHRDIKCANILLDDRFHPKIADFGLARFFPESQTHVSTRVGGTIGYTAPEYAVHGQLTEKADIYSYGIVVLEIISGRKCVEPRLPSPLQLLLEWAWNQFQQNGVLDIVDPLLEGHYPREQALRVITIALLCTQGSWSQRPAMSKIVLMLTDNSESTGQPTRPAFIDAAADRSANITPIPESATSPAAPTQGSHGSISVSLRPR